jgi:hypothetical protein
VQPVPLLEQTQDREPRLGLGLPSGFLLSSVGLLGFFIPGRYSWVYTGTGRSAGFVSQSADFGQTFVWPRPHAHVHARPIQAKAKRESSDSSPPGFCNQGPQAPTVQDQSFPLRESHAPKRCVGELVLAAPHLPLSLLESSLFPHCQVVGK